MIDRYNVYRWKGRLAQYVKMFILRNNLISLAGYCTIAILVIVLICFY